MNLDLIHRWRQRGLKVWKPARKATTPAVSLVDRAPGLAAAWSEAFGDCDGVEVLEGDLLASSADALVSPANSFGDMGGGVDKAIDDHFRGEAQRKVKQAIAKEFFGELPVGVALITSYERRRFPFLISAPTMRLPGEVRGSINAYLSMRAVLVAILTHNGRDTAPPIRSVAVPGLATGIGALPYEDAARQMRAAWDNVLGGDWRHVLHPAMAPFALGRAK